jgi:bacillosamine biosynthesis N-acetyltransferase PglD-like protein
MLKPILIYGAGDTGRRALEILSGNREYQIAGFLDDAKRGTFEGYDILGSGSEPRFTLQGWVQERSLGLHGRSREASRNVQPTSRYGIRRSTCTMLVAFMVRRPLERGRWSLSLRQLDHTP